MSDLSFAESVRAVRMARQLQAEGWPARAAMVEAHERVERERDGGEDSIPGHREHETDGTNQD